MDANGISSLITSVGFPIVMCLLLFWYMKEQNDSHKAESDSMREAINELKIAITALTTKLDGR